MGESPQTWTLFFRSSSNVGSQKLRLKVLDAAKHGGYGHASALAGLVRALDFRDWSNSSRVEKEFALAGRTYQVVKEFVYAGTATQDISRAVFKSVDWYLSSCIPSDHLKWALLALLLKLQGEGLADTEVSAPLLIKHGQRSNIPIETWAKVFRLLSAAQRGGGIDDALKAALGSTDSLVSDCVMMLAKSGLSAKAIPTAFLKMNSGQWQANTTWYLEQLVLLPALGTGSNFTGQFTDVKSALHRELALFLDMKDVRYTCSLLRSLHRQLNCLPSTAWLLIVDFVGLYNPSNNHHALAYATIPTDPATPNVVEMSGSLSTGRVVLDSPALTQQPSITVGHEPNVIQDIQHDEPAASILPEDAAWTQDEMRNSLIECGLTVVFSGGVASAPNSEHANCQFVSVHSVAPSSNAYPEHAEEHDETNMAQRKQGSASERTMIDSGIAGVRDTNCEHTVGFNSGASHNEFSPQNAQTEAGNFLSDPLDESMARPQVGIQSFPTIQLLNFSRHPAAFEETLMNDENLREIREGMARSGLGFKLMDGTKVFTSPHEYKAAMDAIKGMRLGPSFVIASDALVPVVIAAVNQVPRKEHVRIRDRQTLAIMDHSGEAAVAVKQTFLCDVRSFNDDSVTSSTTQAHRGGENPRAHSYPK